MILEIGDGEAEEVREDVAAEVVQRGFAGADEALDTEEADGGLKEKNGYEADDDAVDLFKDLGGWDGSTYAIDRISDEFLEEIRECEGEAGGDEERDE